MAFQSGIVLSLIALLSAGVSPAIADGIDDLKGRFAFDWHKEPASVTCEPIGDDLIATFKSSFTCELTPATNTSSGAPVQVCTEQGEAREYLIFATKAECEEERQTQESAE